VLFKPDIALASAGDPDAMATLVNDLRPRLTKMAAFYARNTGEDTDDLLQEAYVGLLEALARVDLTIGDPEQYLLKHARWRLLDAAKRWRRRRCDALEDDRVDLHPITDWDAEISEMWVDDFAEHLKPTQRAILRYLLIGMTWREAGDGLGCSSANVAYHVRQIQRTYERWSGDDTRTAATRTPVSSETSAGVRASTEGGLVRRDRRVRVAV
jgi:RNA polymerase sigma factor (sigma-70 family)